MQGVELGVTNSELRLRVQSARAARLISFPSTQTVWLGRDQTCDVVLDAQDVSRRHLSLFVKDGELWLRDHSSYGTRVNGQPLQRAVRSVSAPALLELGPYRVEVTLATGVLAVRLLAASPALSCSRAGPRAWTFCSRAEPRAWTRFPWAVCARLVAGGLLLCSAFSLSQRFWSAAEPPMPSAAPAQSPCPPAKQASAEQAPSLRRAVQLLHAGDRLSALHAYRALAARDDSRAELSIVAQLLARELSCQP